MILGGVVWGMTATSRAGGVGKPGSPVSRHKGAGARPRESVGEGAGSHTPALRFMACVRDV